MEVARIAFPDGTDAVVDPDTAHDYITEEFRARFPPPTVAAQFADWRETVVVGELHTWVGWLFSGATDAGGHRAAPFPVRLPDPRGARLPGPAGADGWQIVHVSEDRGAHLDGRPGHPDGDPATEPGVGVVRYLLSRPA